jgi:hypothetical protein
MYRLGTSAPPLGKNVLPSPSGPQRREENRRGEQKKKECITTTRRFVVPFNSFRTRAIIDGDTECGTARLVRWVDFGGSIKIMTYCPLNTTLGTTRSDHDDDNEVDVHQSFFGRVVFAAIPR